MTFKKLLNKELKRYLVNKSPDDTFCYRSKIYFYKCFYVGGNLNFGNKILNSSFLWASYMIGADWFFSTDFGVNMAFGKVDIAYHLGVGFYVDASKYEGSVGFILTWLCPIFS